MNATTEVSDSSLTTRDRLLWTYKDLCAELQVSESYARELVSKFKAPKIRLGAKAIRFEKQEIEKWLRKYFRS